MANLKGMEALCALADAYGGINAIPIVQLLNLDALAAMEVLANRVQPADRDELYKAFADADTRLINAAEEYGRHPYADSRAELRAAAHAYGLIEPIWDAFNERLAERMAAVREARADVIAAVTA